MPDGIDENIKKAIELLVEATARLAEQYFQMPVAGRENPIYRERIYCYELYHLMRQQWPDDFPYSLMGEIDKTKHPLIRGGALDESKPDFLFHVPGNMDSNLLVVEVKPCNARKRDIQHDLQKLTTFCKDAQYKVALYLFYGNEQVGLKAKIREAAKDDDKIDLTRILFYHHQTPMNRAERIEINS